MAFISERELDIVSDKFINLMKYLGIVKSGDRTKHIAQSGDHYYSRQEFTSDMAGIWEPCLQIPRDVSKGDVIGWIYKFPELKKIEIKAPFGGLLLQVRHRQMVHIGTSLFSFGVEHSV